jgi:hypothetical protein
LFLPHKDLDLEFGRVLNREVRIAHYPSELLAAARPELFSHLFSGFLEKNYPGLFDNARVRSAIPDFDYEIGLHEGGKKMQMAALAI